jgi:hypothetical protein
MSQQATIRTFIHLSLASVVLCLTSLSVYAESYSRASSEGRPSSLYTPAGQPEKIEFNYGDIQAWMRGDGSWHIFGTVQHFGLRCGNYELGIRFGIGRPGCANVKWLTDTVYGGRQTQCNNASRNHEGGGNMPELKKEYMRVNCAERVIKCTGNCK